MKYLLTGIFTVILFVAICISYPSNCLAGDEYCEEVIQAWKDVKKMAGEATDEQKAAWVKGMEEMKNCPYFQGMQAFKLFMIKTIHSNSHLYQIVQASCEGCQKQEGGGPCEQCKAWMASLPKETAEKVQARYAIVMVMDKTSQTVMKIMQKIMEKMCGGKGCEQAACDVKDFAGITEQFHALAKEADDLTEMWQGMPAKWEALTEEQKSAIKATAEKFQGCPFFAAEKKTCCFFSESMHTLAGLDAYFAENTTWGDSQSSPEMKPMQDAFGASATLNAKADALYALILKTMPGECKQEK